MNWEIGTHIYTLPYVKQMASGNTNPENFQHIKLAHGGYSENQIIGTLARKLILEII